MLRYYQKVWIFLRYSGLSSLKCFIKKEYKTQQESDKFSRMGGQLIHILQFSAVLKSSGWLGSSRTCVHILTRYFWTFLPSSSEPFPLVYPLINFCPKCWWCSLPAVWFSVPWDVGWFFNSLKRVGKIPPGLSGSSPRFIPWLPVPGDCLRVQK